MLHKRGKVENGYTRSVSKVWRTVDRSTCDMSNDDASSNRVEWFVKKVHEIIKVISAKSVWKIEVNKEVAMEIWVKITVL